MRNSLILLFLAFQLTYSFGQNLRVSYTLTSQYVPPWNNTNKTSLTIVTTSGNYSVATLNSLGTISGNLTGFGTPVQIKIDDSALSSSGSCSHTQFFPISFSAYCSTYSFTNQTICNLVSFSVTFAPIITAPTANVPVNTSVCESDKLNLAATNGYAPYVWQYSTQTGVWNNIPGFITSTPSIGIQDIFGLNYSVHLNQNIYFRYTVGNCDGVGLHSGQIGPYLFEPVQVTGSYSVQSPTCQNGSDGTINISSYSRSPISGEVFSYEIHTSQDVSPSSLVSNTSLQTGNYYGVVISNYGCGPLVFTSITVPPGPRNPLSVSVSITSNYNGAQISCSTSSDGKLTAATNGGGNGAYTYSLDGGSYQGSNTFTGVGEGIHSVTAKDGCPTPTTATNTVSVTAPTPVSISSATPSTCNPTGGQITLSGSGGTGSYSYSDNGGTSYQGSSTFNNLPPNTYSMRIKDANGCVSPINVVNLVGPLIAGSVTPPACSSGPTVALSVLGASGGSGNLKWEVYEASTNILTGSAPSVANSVSVSPGTYYAKVIDASYPICSATTTNFTVNSPLTGSINQTPTPINCFGQTATLTAVPSGGVAPYSSYTWNGVAGTVSFLNAGAGVYAVTFKDSKGCSSSASKTVTTPTQVLINSNLSDFNTYNISCRGGANGTINLSPSGGTPGTPAYTYLWSNGATSQNLSGLPAGSYSVTIKDGNGCSASQNFTLSEPPFSVTVALNSKTDVTCFGSNNGIITVTGSGGVGSISFSKDNWATSQLTTGFSSLSPAPYTISARDANSCFANTSPIVINSPTALTISSVAKSNPLCNGDANGSLSILATGGTGSYQYSNGGAFTSSATFSNLVAGSYVLSVKDQNGCSFSSSTQVLADPPVLNLSSITTPQSCIAIVDGSMTLTGVGGTSPYSFSRDGGLNFQLSGIFVALPTNSYTTVIKDNHGCTTTKSVAVSIQPPLSGSINQSGLINCYGESTGALSISASGGTSPYSYAWSNGSTTQNINGLAANTYSVVVTDSKNCTASQNIIVSQPPLLTISSSSSNYNGYGVSCQTSTDGFINAIPNGGTSPYTYMWSNGATGNSISGLVAGGYSVAVTDSKSCTANLPVALSAPALLNLVISSKTNVTCHGGSDGAIMMSSSGGVGTYTYSIDGVRWQSSPTFSLLTANPYTLEVKDANNCASVVSANIVEPSAIAINIGIIRDAGCGLSNGSIQSSASGGTGALSYLWLNALNQTVGNSANLTNSPSGIYSLTVADQSACAVTTSANISSPNGPAFSVVNQVAASCSYSADGRAAVSITSGPSPYIVNWGDGETGTSAIHLGAGSTTVTVIDANNCSTIQSFATMAPLPISLSSTLSNSPTCSRGNDGSIQVTAIGGNAPYTYAWNGNAGSNSLSGISPGTYSLRVTDANSCAFSQNITVADVAPIVVDILNQVTPSCASSTDGSLYVQATGGSGALTYLWSTTVPGPQLNSVGAGNYSIKVTDSRNCSKQREITLIAPTPITESLSVTPALCNGGSSGTIMSTPQGGTGTYTFSKDNGNSWQPQNFFTALSAGSYEILAKDVNGCTTSSSTIVTEPAALVVSISKIDPTCGQSNGSTQATVNGGIGVYGYQWINSVSQSVGNNSFLQNALSDEYTLTVTDANNCTSTATVLLPPYPAAKFSVTNIRNTVCSYSADGSANVEVTSVQSPYSISWSSGETSASATKLIAGQNTVTITDANNCQFTKTIQVPSPSAITLVSESTVSPVCAGGAGTIQSTPTGGAGAFTYTWNGVAGQNSIQNAKAGSYDLVIKDASGCTLSKTYTLIDPPLFVINLGMDQTICPNTTTSIGMTLPNATYLWRGPNGFTSTQGIVSVGTEGEYQETVTNSDGCKATSNIRISISDNLLKADFLTVSKAHVGDTLAIIDISWPIPDQIKWETDGATIIYADNNYALITFSNPGTFKIGVTATQGGCQDEYYQTVSVDDLPTGGEAKHKTDDLQVSSIIAYPNPFVGKTNAKIELSGQGVVTLKVFSMTTNRLILSHEFQGDKTYIAEIDFGEREAGLYIIVVESGSKTKAIRVVKL